MKKKTQINIFSENIHKIIVIDEKKAIDIAKKLLNHFLQTENIVKDSCLDGLDFNCISFDILYCDDEKTHEINKAYRQKDAPADIITFAIFADSEEKFIFDGEINLGEILISLDKVCENAKEKRIASRGRNGTQECELLETRLSRATEEDTSDSDELYFLISHGIMHLLGFDHQTIEEYNFIVEAQNIALNKIKE